ncbi:potassium channel family protein [Aureibacter tunicatorum]|uniref:Voltage-gated potassium channel n=1 Tax=Aureibacter tunicatorum TaxID=866807 RepID=A0AAE3XH86_9BACT|nr:potassium channel protein [Aureibacter tunicatorum]MDR6237621.1 voltage-gated potassium channel [Aureibacter tunicatorum]
MSITTGVCFYHFYEDYSFIDAVYMTAITISTVGYSEINELSPEGRMFTSVYVFFNLMVFAFSISTLTAYLFEGEFKKIYKIFMIGMDVKKLKNHVIVCGYGRNGVKACEELANSNTDFVVIENNQELIKETVNSNKINFIYGDATLDETLHSAQIQHASAIITTLPRDAENVFITLTARELNPEINIIARAHEENTEKKLTRAGANHIVKPDTLGGMTMAMLITKPVVIEFLELLNGMSHNEMVLEEFNHSEFKDEFKELTLRELDIRKKTNVMVIGLKDNNKGFIFTPSSAMKMKDDSYLILLGKEENIEKFKKVYSREE